MAALKGPAYTIDSVASFVAGQSQIVGPIPGDFKIVEAVFHGNTLTKVTGFVGTYVNGVFTAVTQVIAGSDGNIAAPATLGATSGALGTGVEVTLAAAGPITSGQYIRIAVADNTLARWTLTLVPSSTAAGFATDTTPA